MASNEADYRIRPMEMEDLGCVLQWRNHCDVRCFMYSQHEITTDEHKSWFESAAEDPAKHILILESGSQPLGFVQFSELLHGRVAEWGFYVDPEASRGTGRKLGLGALDYAFRRIGYHKVCGQALAFNERSIIFHNSMGFLEEGVLREQHFDGERYHDVVCFGLLKIDWRKNG